ncbi:MAG: NAD(P)H-dependent glycerol-3-phosphate dehydrogenase [Desulfobacterales bacterium]|nr:NAD(P)H-dependent glycerol-3-phosphate dehydrogenase [Desulfobacterales bacterium]
MKNQADNKNMAIGVVGAGSWGTALSNLLATKGYPVDLWVFEKEVRDQIQACGENQVFLPGITLSSRIFATNDVARVASGKALLVIVLPSHVFRKTVRRFKEHIAGDTVIVSASKGIEIKTHLTMSGVLSEELPAMGPEHLAVLSGPTFAREVAQNVPTVVTVAAANRQVAGWVQQVFASPFFRVYTGDDMLGVELGGAIKNVIAIAAGIADGLGLGYNTRAALITRGLAEIRRLGVKLGANPKTFSGLAGVGDLVLTCTGDLSRNYTVGKNIGKGKRLKEILSEMRMVAEGIKTAKSVYELSIRVGVEMPISHEVYRILYHGLSPQKALRRLMARNLKQELDEQ